MSVLHPTIGAVLDQIAPRLRSVRQRKGVSLADLEEATGISKSTLSRLETAQRKPSLELLLPITAALGVTLDRIVASPRVAAPVRAARTGERLRAPGRVLVPLAPRRGRRAAHLLIVPESDNEPHLRSHAGHQWLYVLSGRLRLLQDDREIVVEAGEAAEFGCGQPHWFGSTGRGEVQLLSIFSQRGGRLRLRTVES